ncbi:hypothetical protein [Paenibacillus mucilaginosus]|uniref:Uncharacterized protein n=3 Tax=Paenibacillus mucilaginosus TaxID=61624 RepID=H6NT65_9BACL|nr:hypothetical protein [Paenibacillus mucilaginosus]AEI38746.1 hypothetical protein KNP414_00095 [Paenibacillus mucilaginosus KNP414]AFC27078.1 hypothetical protein PM3016_91 [Paenibacillus mucilaginosus 3016]AFH59214.1 hypothetical protein B2K_00455 [Paenibacillus mucilaginosus K02]MCG7215880.1 hypothetical protein [Paenibacillus mucilaginosus]WDM27828.1 hypothetical protein KCX80_00465 [Paenibacillus mucilaginosus]
MMLGLVWIIGCYAAGIAVIHALHRQWKRRGTRRAAHYVLYAQNAQMQLEWYLRSLYFFSWIKGRPIEVTLVDEGSTDETLQIAARIAQEQALNVVESPYWNMDTWIEGHQEQDVVVIRLNQIKGLESAYKWL